MFKATKRARRQPNNRRSSSLSVTRLNRFSRRSAVIVALTAVLFGAQASAQQNGPTEYQLKAAFLFNFAKFVEWPPSSFAYPKAPFVICILGTDPFGQSIDDTLRGQSIGTHGVAVLRVHDASQLRHCQMAFISPSEKTPVQAVLQMLRGANVLLVGETPGFASAGGAIQFEMRNNRIRFSINPGAAQRAGLQVSSKLLSLATIVHDGESAGGGKG